MGTLIGKPPDPAAYRASLVDHTSVCRGCRRALEGSVATRPEHLCSKGSEFERAYERAQDAWTRWQRDAAVARLELSSPAEPDTGSRTACTVEEPS